MNKSILIGVPIAIIVILFGIYLVSSGTGYVEESSLEIIPDDEYQPKHYTQSLSEAVSVTTP